MQHNNAGDRQTVSPPSWRVLVIEDNEDAADTLRDVLELSEHTVEVAYNGPDGLRKAKAFGPDVVFCDIGMPGMDGYEVARMVRADPALRSTHLVALTGYGRPEDFERATAVGFDRHIVKPPSIKQIEAVLDGLPKRCA